MKSFTQFITESTNHESLLSSKGYSKKQDRAVTNYSRYKGKVKSDISVHTLSQDHPAYSGGARYEVHAHTSVETHSRDVDPKSAYNKGKTGVRHKKIKDAKFASSPEEVHSLISKHISKYEKHA